MKDFRRATGVQLHGFVLPSSPRVFQFIVERTAKPKPCAKVSIFSDVHAPVARDEGVIRARLNVVNAAAVVIVAGGKQHAKALVGAKSHACGAASQAEVTRVLDWREPAESFQLQGMQVAGFLGHQVHGATNRLGILIRGERFAEFDRTDDVGGNRVQLELAHIVLRRRKLNPIDRRIVQARLRTTDLNKFAFTLVALQAYSGHPASNIGDVGVRQTLNHGFGHDIQKCCPNCAAD
jgi:hypothetical protein